MKKIGLLFSVFCLLFSFAASGGERFPDGTPIPEWFRDYTRTDVSKLGTQYRLTDHGVATDSAIVQTAAIQAVIDRAAADGGGVVVVPAGTFLSGAIFFKPGTHLHLEAGAKLKGSDDISDFPVIPTRLEGRNIDYFAGLVNADSVDGFTISGTGTIDGNGLRFWKSFWLRRQWNPQCTNLDEQRPRLVVISNSRDVQLSGVRLHNSPFWTTHIYKCVNVKLFDLHIFAPHEPVKAPSSDAVDLDVCTNVLIKNCYMSVNDDAVALKGGKGPTADKEPGNGGNYNIIVEDCAYGLCHSALTCGSESIHNRNIILRRITLDRANRVLWLKMRPDTPQLYEYITVEDITGSANNMLYIRPWTQFFDLQGQTEMPRSYGRHITLRNIELTCPMPFNMAESDQYELSDFTFERVIVNQKAVSMEL